MFLKKQKFIKMVVGFLSLVLLFNILSVLPACATEDPTQEVDYLGLDYAKDTGLAGGDDVDIRTTVARIIRTALGLLGIVALVIILYGGYVYMTAGGNEEKVATAKKIILNGTIGLAIILSSYAIASFVLSKLMDATGTYPSHCFNSICDEDEDCNGGAETRPDCGGSCRTCSTDLDDNTFLNSFFIRKLPTAGQRCVTNLKPSIIFSQKIDFDTLRDSGGNWKINVYEIGETTPVSGDWASEDDGMKIKFTPDLSCGDSCSDGCFSPNTDYKLVVSKTLFSSIKSQSDHGLLCGAPTSHSAGCGPVEFTSGDRCDSTPPVVEITYPDNSGSLNSGELISVQVSSTDDIAIDYIELKANDNQRAEGFIQFEGCQTQVSTTFDWRVDYVDDLTLNKLEAKSYDQAENFDSDIINVNILPEHCSNQVKDADETGVDCGGSCGGCGGDVCTDDLDCRSGYCYKVEGVCLDKTRITDVSPLRGALGTFVTISGYYFGDDIGDVYFAKNTEPIVEADWEKASIVDCGAGVDAWSPWQVIVESPLTDGQTGPIKIIASSTLYSTDIPIEHRTDLTNDSWSKDIDDFIATSQDRPGLCPIDPPTGTQKMDLDLLGIRFGDPRGDSTQNFVYFGEIGDGGNGKAKIRSWTDGGIELVVPGIDKGKVGVQVVNDNVSSNVVEFRMIESIDPTLPWVDHITPKVGAPEEYITITGNNFGSFVVNDLHSNNSVVTFEEVDSDPVVVLAGSFDFPEECDSSGFWKNDQIIVKFPKNGGNIGSEYIVKVTRGGDGEQSPLGINFDLANDLPAPGICGMTPFSAPLPFLAEDVMTLYGENLADTIDGVDSLGVYYFNNANLVATSTVGRLEAEGTLAFENGTTTLTGIFPPYYEDANGKVIDATTINSGPVVVAKTFDKDGEDLTLVSNPYDFEILDCKAKVDGEEIGCTQNNYECCEIKDTEKGFCMPAGECPGTLRSAGYMWRFCTKDIPPVPKVIENCYEGVAMPSPAPNIRWNQTEYEKDHVEVCKQALVTVEFSMAMDPATLIADNIIVRKCNNIDENEINKNYNICTSTGEVIVMEDEFGKTGDIISNHFSVDQSTTYREALSLFPASGEWATSTWYQVVLKNEIKSAGTEDIEQINLSRSRPCGDDNAYCFLFKTGVEDCKLSGIAILPDNYWTKVLEAPIIHRSIFGESDLFWKGTGKTQQKCINMDVKGYDWDWEVRYATVTTTGTGIDYRRIDVADESDDYYSNIHYENLNSKIFGIKNKREVDANAYTVKVGLTDYNTPINGQSEIQYVDNVYVYALASTSTAPSHFDMGELKIGAGDPKIIEFWPNCLEACTNAEVGVRFNTMMSNDNLSPFQSGIYKIEECVDENCFSTVSATNTTTEGNVEDILQEHVFEEETKYTVLKIANSNTIDNVNLKPNTLYKVTVSATSTEMDVETDNNVLWSVASISDRTKRAKPYNTEFSWRFRTKESSCLVDRVDVDPESYTARSLADKTIYVAQPYSEPDSCSENGQKLNPWDNDWDWSSSDVDVAIVEQYEIKYKSAYCTDKCVLKGSDIPADFADVVIPICGNGIVEAGEDCDTPNKLMGCGINCLHTGEIDYTLLGGGSCGDGIVNTTSLQIVVAGVDKTIIYSEECDPTHPDKLIREGCSETCLNIGSKAITDSEDVEASICGNGGNLGTGEDCELGITASSTDPSSSYGCSQNCLHVGTKISKRWCTDNRVLHGGFATTTYNKVCDEALSQCGDGILSLDEDAGCDGENGSWALGGNCRDEVGTCDCDEFCLKTIPKCTIGSEGCDSNGKFVGSGLRHSTPSVCGDGIGGIGENPLCESVEYRTAEFDTKVGPWTLVTAQGAGDGGDDLVQFVSSSIQAEAIGDKVKNSSKKGSGDFLIPCGFESDEACQAYFGDEYGVGKNSCCFVRPSLLETYPVDGNTDICPNTVIKAKFDQTIDEDTLYNNVILAYGLTQNDLDTVAPDEPVKIASSQIKTQKIDILNNKLYSINGVKRERNIIEIWDISDKNSPLFLSTTTTGKSYFDLHIENGYLFLVGEGNDGDFVEIWDVFDDKNPKLVYILLDDVDVEDGIKTQVEVNGNYLYVLGSDHNLKIWKIESIKNLIPISTTNIENSTKFKIFNDYIFFLKGTDGLDIYKINDLLSVSNPQPLTKTGDLLGVSGIDHDVVNDLDIIGDKLYVVSNNIFRVYKFNFEENGETSKMEFNTIAINGDGYKPDTVNNFNNIKVNGDFVYATKNNKAYIIDISNSTSPTNAWILEDLTNPEIKVFGSDELIYIFNRDGDEVGNYLDIYDISAYFKLDCKRDVTSLIQDVPEEITPVTWYQNIWKRIVMYFKNLFGFEVIASSTQPRYPIVKWCEDDKVGNLSVVEETNTSTSRIVMDLQKPLKTDTDYAVILNYSVRDVRGVKIGKSDDGFRIYWKFVTDNLPGDVPICAIEKTEIIPSAHDLVHPYKIDGVEAMINPAEVFFTKTGVTTSLEAIVHSENDQEIQAVDGYRWNYIWEPENNDFVDVEITTSSFNNIQAHNQNGEADVLATANLTENDYPDYKKGRTGETGSAHITVFLCENPWPPIGSHRYNSTTGHIFPYEDVEGNNDGFVFGTGVDGQGQFSGNPSESAVRGGYFNFKFYYCADGGLSGEEDDLPYLKPIVQPGRTSFNYKGNTDLNHDFNRLTFFEKTKTWLRNLVVQDVYAANCVDSDGMNFGNKGTVIDDNHPDGVEDFCVKKKLREGICILGNYVEHRKDCLDFGSGYDCVDGACVSPEGSACGNGDVEAGEDCDDGNTMNNDGCSNQCVIESSGAICGNGYIEDGEECDDGDDESGDGCDGDCSVEPDYECTTNNPSVCNNCGDGLVVIGIEECDDGNDSDDDGCSSECRVGLNFACDSSEPSVCTKYKCSDNDINTIDEVCDGTDLNNKTCINFNDPSGDQYSGGSLTCDSDCLGFDTSTCEYCGDGICNGAEAWPECVDCNPHGLIGEALKRFIFTAEGSSDAIGIQVFSNPDHLTVSKWHSQNTESGSLPMQSLVIDGYDAVTDGNNIYIDALNYTGTSTEDGVYSAGTMWSNIYLFSRNAGASSEMLNVFEQIISNVEFNANLTNYGYCGNDVLNPDHEVTCMTDRDCPIDKVCSNQKDKLKRNYKRLRDLQKMKNDIDEYSDRQYPNVVAYWNFNKLYTDEFDNEYIVDKVHGNHAKCGVGGCPQVVTSAESGIEYTGINTSGGRYLKIEDKGENDTFDFDGNSEFTILGWVKRTGVNSGKPFQSIIAKGDYEKLSWGFGVSQINGNKLQFNRYVEGKWRRYLTTDDFIVNDTGWSFIGMVLTRNEEGVKGVKYYLNDKISDIITTSFDNDYYTTSSLDKYPIMPNDEELRIGTSIGDNRKFVGNISDLIIYNRALSDEEVNSHRFSFPDFSDSYPSMSEGSYLAGQTLSVWGQSWSKLSSQIGKSLPTDPINKLGISGSCLHSVSDNPALSETWVFCQSDADCNDSVDGTAVCTFHDPVTGWSAEDRRFSFACDNLRSYAYRYIHEPNTALGYKIKTKFEDIGLDDSWDINNREDFVNAFIDPVRIYIDDVCNTTHSGGNTTQEISSMSAGFCGDGKLNLNLGEICDPAGSTRSYITDPDCKDNNQYKLEICSNDCKRWIRSDVETCTQNDTDICIENSPTVCYDGSFDLCGNGKVDAGESCDDGVMNGKYNQCNDDCNGVINACAVNNSNNVCDDNIGDPGFCGDGILNSKYELCDYVSLPHYNSDILESCSWDCQNYGPYCGDGIVQSEEGEECDGSETCSINNETGKRYCDDDCKKINTNITGAWYKLTSAPYQKDTSGNGMDLFNRSNTFPSSSGIYRDFSTTINPESYSNAYFSLSIPSTTLLFENNSITLEAWVYPLQTASGTIFYRKASSTDDNATGGFNFGCDDIGEIILELCVDEYDDNCDRFESDETIKRDSWNHVAFSISDNHQISVFVNGVEKPFEKIGYKLGTTLGNEFSIGGVFSDLCVECQNFKGLIKEVRIYKENLASSLILDHYNNDGWNCDVDIESENKYEPDCGNGKIDEIDNEICDRGGENGIPCTLDSDDEYCTYCSWDCKEIVDVYEVHTYDPTVNCGDGVVQEAFEVCDDYKHIPSKVGSNPNCNSDCQSYCGNGKVEVGFGVVGSDPLIPNEFCDPLDPTTRGGCNDECKYDRCEALSGINYINCGTYYDLGWCGDGVLQTTDYSGKSEGCDYTQVDPPIYAEGLFEKQAYQECVAYSGYEELCYDCDDSVITCHICSDGSNRFGSIDECNIAEDKNWSSFKESLCGTEYEECSYNEITSCLGGVDNCNACSTTFSVTNDHGNGFLNLSDSRVYSGTNTRCTLCTPSCRLYENVKRSDYESQ